MKQVKRSLSRISCFKRTPIKKMSLEDVRIKYNVQTKKITKSVSFQTSLNAGALFECS